MCMRLQYSCTTPNRRTLKLRSFWLKKCDLHNGLNLHKHIQHIWIFFLFFCLFFHIQKSFFKNAFYTLQRRIPHIRNHCAIQTVFLLYLLLYFQENSGTFSCNVHTLPSLEGPNLGQTPQMKVIHIWPVHRGSDSKILNLTVLLRPADLLNKK